MVVNVRRKQPKVLSRVILSDQTTEELWTVTTFEKAIRSVIVNGTIVSIYEDQLISRNTRSRWRAKTSHAMIFAASSVPCSCPVRLDACSKRGEKSPQLPRLNSKIILKSLIIERSVGNGHLIN